MAATTLEGRVALVPGATSGIGLAIAEALAERGAKVAVAGRRAAIAEEEARRPAGSAGSGPAWTSPTRTASPERSSARDGSSVRSTSSS